MSLEQPWDATWVDALCNSYRHWLGRTLGSELVSEPTPAWLYYQAPFCLLAHDGASDPRFVYANVAAQRCFEYAAHELLGLPSRLSAEAPDRAERDALLRTVTTQGYAEGYRGLRVAKSGRRFWIENVTVWNVLDPSGRWKGQAAVYRRTTPA